jgi:alkylated DNA repair dioxygenase AlkB
MQYLDSNKLSWVEVDKLPDNLIQYSNENFDKMFSYHPDLRAKVIMYDKEVDCHRWQQSYLHTPKYRNLVNTSYMFCGKNSDIKDTLPDEFQVLFDHVNTNLYNQVTINWYDDGNDYIAYHSDYTAGLNTTDILVVNLVKNEDQLRKFCIKPKSKNFNYLNRKVEIPLYNGTIIKMCGDTQLEFRHGVPKVKDAPKRISLSFRSYST